MNDVLPDVSVILVFHSRLEYLNSALDSVLRQNLPSERFEIILVGPTRPPDLPERDSPPSVRLVTCDEPGLGAKIARGVQAARAGVIAFLEDDDLYARGRLAFLVDAFRSDPSLTYLQNGFDVIDEGGQPRSPKDLHVRMMRAWKTRGIVRVPGPTKTQDLKAIRAFPAGFNISSIAVRRGLLAGHLDLFQSVDMLVDVTLLYLSLLAPGYLRFDPVSLTVIRKHASSDSNPQVRDSSELLSRMRAYLQRGQSGWSSLVRYVSESGNPAVTHAVEGHEALETLILSIRSPEGSRTERGRSILRAFSRLSTFEVRRYWTALPMGVVCFLSPRLGSRSYVWLRNMWEGNG